MDTEIKDQLANGNFNVMKKSQVPKDTQILPTVWQMRRKRDIMTGKITKYKARLNVDGSRMKQGIHYNETYVPVANWSTVRLVMTLVTAFNWHTVQLDYVQAFPQAPVEKPIYLKIPIGFRMSKGHPNDYVLQVNRNVYGQKQASRIWNKHLVYILAKKLNFKQSDYDTCLFYRGQTLYVLYTDDSILAGPNKKEIDTIIKEIKDSSLNITILGNIKDFLGVNITRTDDGRLHVSQPHLIQQIIDQVHMKKATPKSTPAKPSAILHRQKHLLSHTPSFNYRSVIGKLNYLERGSRSDISYATHQCARFSSNPKPDHESAVRWLIRYLIGTKDKGYFIDPKSEKGLEVHVDADFCGNWENTCPEKDKDTARSQYGYIISYLGAPIVWK